LTFLIQLSLLSIDALKKESEQLRAHLVLSLLAHAYIVGFPKINEPLSLLPESIAVPWFKVSQLLGLQPVVSYASLELANYTLLNPAGKFELDNLAMLHTFSGSFDEAWFYLVPLGIEIEGASALQALLDALKAFQQGTNQLICTYLDIMKQKLEAMTLLLKRMYEKNDPHIFWHRVRPYSGKKKLQKTLFFFWKTYIIEA
jgi:indoleamine 2,3-dioxygenase